jgi:hypothetical protein
MLLDGPEAFYIRPLITPTLKRANPVPELSGKKTALILIPKAPCVCTLHAKSYVCRIEISKLWAKIHHLLRGACNNLLDIFQSCHPGLDPGSRNSLDSSLRGNDILRQKLVLGKLFNPSGLIPRSLLRCRHFLERGNPRWMPVFTGMTFLSDTPRLAAGQFIALLNI